MHTYLLVSLLRCIPMHAKKAVFANTLYMYVMGDVRAFKTFTKPL